MSQAPSDNGGKNQNVKKFKRGDIIFREGEKADHVYAIQSGRVSLEISRPDNRIEVLIVQGSHILGEESLFGLNRYPLTAEVLSDASVLEMPASVIKQQIESLPGLLKLLVKSMGEQMKKAMQELRSIKMEKDSKPCPHLFVPRLFAIIHLVSRHLGKKLENGDIEISWNTLKVYAIRMFLEAPQRLQSCIEILTKLKYIEMIQEKNDEGDVELNRLIIKNVQIIEDFGEFFHYNLYKGGNSEIVHYDEIAWNVASIFVKCAESAEVDRQGAVRVTFNQVSEVVKEELGVQFKNTHIDLLEKKGLFMKRTPLDKEVWLSFDKKEFSNTIIFWKIINEIDKWNKAGRVNMAEEPPKKKPKPGEATCPECGAGAPTDLKFCGQCGFKLKAA